LKGHAWIAAEGNEILRLQTDLVAPLPEIPLQREHLDYLCSCWVRPTQIPRVAARECRDGNQLSWPLLSARTPIQPFPVIPCR